MKYVKQFGIILAVTCFAEILKYVLPLPIPASIYGLCVMFLLLVTRTLKLNQVGETAHFLIDIMPLMFIPAGVALMNSWSVLKAMILPVCVITVVSTITVMVSAGRTTQWIRKRKGDKQDE